MPKRIPISAAKRFALDPAVQGRQVVCIVWDGELNHIVSYGVTQKDCRQAAVSAGFYMDLMQTEGREDVMKVIDKYFPVEEKTSEEAKYDLKKLQDKLDRFNPNSECPACDGMGVDGDPYSNFDYSIRVPCPKCWSEK